jgi:Resolvase, N terminal domain
VDLRRRGPFRGATLVRPALEALRDLAAQGCVDVVLVYSPDRLARKFACQALLLEEFARAGVRVEFVKGPRGDSPEDQLLIQFQGCWSRTSSSAPRKSPSATASPPGQAAPAPASATPDPTRRVTIARIIYCVGGVVDPP